MMIFRAICNFAGASKFVGAAGKIERVAVRQMSVVTHDALRQMKGDYLRRGGTFRRTKGRSVYRGPGGTRATGWTGAALRSPGGREWVKNPSAWLRVGNGVLVSSWHVIPPRIEGTRVIGMLATNCPYARIHEEGGNTGRGGATHLQKRSYIAPMMKDNRAKWRDWFGTDLVATLRAKG